MAADRTQRDDDGFLMSPSEEFSNARYAIVSESVDVDVEGPDWAAKDFLGTIRIRSESERPVFVVTEIGRKPRYSERLGAAPESPPGDQEFWAASTAGAGERTLEWEPEDGHWSIVVMNTDGSRGGGGRAQHRSRA